MLSALGDHGAMGLTAVADTQPEADALYQRAVGIFKQEAADALKYHA